MIFIAISLIGVVLLLLSRRYKKKHPGAGESRSIARGDRFAKALSLTGISLAMISSGIMAGIMSGTKDKIAHDKKVNALVTNEKRDAKWAESELVRKGREEEVKHYNDHYKYPAITLQGMYDISSTKIAPSIWEAFRAYEPEVTKNLKFMASPRWLVAIIFVAMSYIFGKLRERKRGNKALGLLGVQPPPSVEQVIPCPETELEAISRLDKVIMRLPMTGEVSKSFDNGYNSARLKYRTEITNTNNRIQSKCAQIARLTKDLEISRTAQITIEKNAISLRDQLTTEVTANDECKSTIKKRNEEIANVSANLTLVRSTLKSRVDEINKLHETIASLRGTAMGRRCEIGNLEKKFMNQHNDIVAFKEMNTNQVSMIEKLTADNTNQKDRLTRLTNQNASLQQVNTNQKNTIEKLRATPKTSSTIVYGLGIMDIIKKEIANVTETILRDDLAMSRLTKSEIGVRRRVVERMEGMLNRHIKALPSMLPKPVGGYFTAQDVKDLSEKIHDEVMAQSTHYPGDETTAKHFVARTKCILDELSSK